MKYLYNGKEYTWAELIEMLIVFKRLEEKKKGFWKANDIDIYSFSAGFNDGMLYGVKLMLDAQKDLNLNKLIE